MKSLVCAICLCISALCLPAQQHRGRGVAHSVMQSIYKLVKTPYKYGLVIVPANDSKKVDCPTVFRQNGKWFMTYLVFDGRGYETWLAKSNDLLHWNTMGRIMSFSDTSDWDGNQKAGYVSLLDYRWGASYGPQRFKDKYWMSYLGGGPGGYEVGPLSIGMAYTRGDFETAYEWERLQQPVLTSTDEDARWWENNILYKSSVIWDKSKATGHPFVMYYNARGDSVDPHPTIERIGMAVSDDMQHWKRFGKDPVLGGDNQITGDAVIQKIGNVWVMFYFGAFGKKKPGAFNRFACSYDLVHWTDWTGDDLIKPSEAYDNLYAHKSFVLKYKGTVYHFYCAVNTSEQRGIAVATSRYIGKGSLQFSKRNK
jgi:predicted GH43/DUF377 family glycosyl hydrolase